MSQVFFRDEHGIIGTGVLVNGRPVRVSQAYDVEGKLVSSFRSTTSSRLPGRAIEGTVWRKARQLVACAKCHRLRMDFGGPHAPQVHADGSQTDCVGDVVRVARVVR